MSERRTNRYTEELRPIKALFYLIHKVWQQVGGTAIGYFGVNFESGDKMTQVPYVQEVVTPFYIVRYYMKWVTTSWTYSIQL